MVREIPHRRPLSSKALTPLERRLCDWLADKRGAMIALLAKVVNIDSGSSDKAGVDAVGERFRRFLTHHGVATAAISRQTRGDILKATLISHGAVDRASVLLMGHCDTVFGKGEAARRPFAIVGNRARGPGVADMKAGLVMNSFLLAAFQHFDCLDSPLVALYTSDEEVGSGLSRGVIEEEARKAVLVLNAEPGRVSGNLVSERKGGSFLRFRIKGKSAHAGVDFAAGASAISELAHKIVAMDAITDVARGVTLNVGLVRGGQSVNTTAPDAQGSIDIRYNTLRDRQDVLSKIENIIARSWVAGTSATLEMTGEFLPLLATAESTNMFERYRAAARDLGFDIGAERTGGCADSGFAASMGAPTLCGTGPVGGGAHTLDEYVELDTLVPRAQAAALTILRLDQTMATARTEGNSVSEVGHALSLRRAEREATHVSGGTLSA
jgi:glutamate carboxypeptidase